MINQTCFAVKELKIGVINIPPFGIAEDLKHGIHYDFISKLLSKMKIRFDIDFYPYSRAVNSIENGTLDLSIFFKRDDPGNMIEVCKTFGFENLILSKNKVNSIANLEMRSVAIIRNAKYESNFDKNSKIKKIQTENYVQSLKLLILNRVDAVIIPAPAYYFYKKSMELDKNDVKLQFVLNKKYNYIYAKKSINPVLIEQIKLENDFLIKNKYDEDLLVLYGK